MRRNLFSRISIAGILIQLVVCMPALAANLKTATTTKYRVTGVVKDALGRPLKNAALSLQASNGKAVAHASSNDAGQAWRRPPALRGYSTVSVRAATLHSVRRCTAPTPSGAA